MTAVAFHRGVSVMICQVLFLRQRKHWVTVHSIINCVVMNDTMDGSASDVTETTVRVLWNWIFRKSNIYPTPINTYDMHKQLTHLITNCCRNAAQHITIASHWSYLPWHHVLVSLQDTLNNSYLYLHISYVCHELQMPIIHWRIH